MTDITGVPGSERSSAPSVDDIWFERELQIAAKPPWWLWKRSLKYVGALLHLFGRIEITGTIPTDLRQGPLLVAPNHIGNFDTFLVAYAMFRVGLWPRFMVTAGILNAPIFGPWLERSGGIRVNRRAADGARSLAIVDVALQNGGHLCVYPEGRVSLDPDLWPEKGKTGLARIALKHPDVPVIPAAQWGAHEVIKYDGGKQMVTSFLTALWRQPKLRVHFGEPVDLTGLTLGRPGDANRAHRRILGAVTRDLRMIRSVELGPPRYVDETRPISDHPTALFPGGVVPDELP